MKDKLNKFIKLYVAYQFFTQDLTQNILVYPTKLCAQLKERGTDKDLKTA